jgi:hypothetical protein
LQDTTLATIDDLEERFTAERLPVTERLPIIQTALEHARTLRNEIIEQAR